MGGKNSGRRMVNENTPLTRLQSQVYLMVLEGVRKNGFPPTLFEIGAALGIKTKQAVSCHMKAIAKRGILGKGPRNAWWPVNKEKEQEGNVVILNLGQSGVGGGPEADGGEAVPNP